MGSKKQSWGISDLEPKLIVNQIWAFFQLESKENFYDSLCYFINNLIVKWAGNSSIVPTQDSFPLDF